MREVSEGNDVGQVLSGALAASAIWAAGHPELRTWYCRRGRYAFDVTFQVRLRALRDGQQPREVTFGPRAVEALRQLQRETTPEALN